MTEPVGTAAPEGLLLIDKPGGMTSHDVVDRVRRALGTRKVGHAGTLDPMATGLLVVGVGRATRLLRFLSGLDKVYEGTGRLGEETDTLDADGQITRTAPVIGVTRAGAEAAMAAHTWSGSGGRGWGRSGSTRQWRWTPTDRPCRSRRPCGTCRRSAWSTPTRPSRRRTAARSAPPGSTAPTPSSLPTGVWWPCTATSTPRPSRRWSWRPRADRGRPSGAPQDERPGPGAVVLGPHGPHPAAGDGGHGLEPAGRLDGRIHAAPRGPVPVQQQRAA